MPEFDSVGYEYYVPYQFSCSFSHNENKYITILALSVKWMGKCLNLFDRNERRDIKLAASFIRILTNVIWFSVFVKIQH